LQEILYRALEREPKNRYARRMILPGTDPSGPGRRRGPGGVARLAKTQSQLARKILYYTALALIPVVMLLLMILVAHHHR